MIAKQSFIRKIMSYKYHPKPSVCPACDSDKILDIVYGYPAESLDKGAQQGKVILGGCVITGDDPQWQCSKCGTDFYRIKKD
mgnify:CR=1 FL=1